MNPNSASLLPAPTGLAGWTRLFADATLPILSDTATALAELDPEDDTLDAHRLVLTIHRDPFAALKTYRSVAGAGPVREFNVIETLTASAVMLGVPRLLTALRDAPTLDDVLSDETALGTAVSARQGVMRVVARARRAADFAYDWALRRQDLDAEVIAMAALLHDFAEMLLWCLRPNEALAIQHALAATPGLRSAEAQRAVLGIELNELENALMLRWRLPELITRITHDHDAAHVRVRNVRLAVDVARHSSEGWHNPALPDDFAELADLLHVNAGQARHIAMSL